MLNPPCCDCKVICPDPADPINNLSAERPDQELFIGYSHGSPQQPPPTGWTWGTPGCVSFCTSTVSQEDADLCAVRQQLICTTQNCNDQNCSGGGGDGGWHAPGQPGNPAVFANAPQSCVAECPDGFPFTYTLPANQVFQLNQNYANQVAESLACDLADQNKLCLSSINGGACVNQFFNGVITATGGSGTFSFSIIFGSLPVGITSTQIGDTFVLSGTPLFPGNYTVTVQCVDSLGSFMNKTYTVFVLGLTSFPTTGNVGSAYNFTFTAAGGVPPFTYAVVAGALPAGLSLAANGIVSGTPTTAGTSNFTVQITDSAGNTCTEPLTVVISGCGCNVFDWRVSTPATVGNFRLRIHGFVGTVHNCPTAGPPLNFVQVDGTFPAWSGIPGNWQTVGRDLENKDFAGGIISWNGAVWHINLLAGDLSTVWDGTRADTCPIGAYTLNVGCNAPPATLTVECYSL